MPHLRQRICARGNARAVLCELMHARVCVCAPPSPSYSWPYLASLSHNLGAILIAWSGLRAFRPDIYLDTTGCAFTYYIAKLLAGCKVATFTNNPSIFWVRGPPLPRVCVSCVPLSSRCRVRGSFTLVQSLPRAHTHGLTPHTRARGCSPHLARTHSLQAHRTRAQHTHTHTLIAHA